MTTAIHHGPDDRTRRRADTLRRLHGDPLGPPPTADDADPCVDCGVPADGHRIRLRRGRVRLTPMCRGCAESRGLET